MRFILIIVVTAILVSCDLNLEYKNPPPNGVEEIESLDDELLGSYYLNVEATSELQKKRGKSREGNAPPEDRKLFTLEKEQIVIHETKHIMLDTNLMDKSGMKYELRGSHIYLDNEKVSTAPCEKTEYGYWCEAGLRHMNIAIHSDSVSVKRWDNYLAFNFRLLVEKTNWVCWLFEYDKNGLKTLYLNEKITKDNLAELQEITPAEEVGEFLRGYVIDPGKMEFDLIRKRFYYPAAVFDKR